MFFSTQHETDVKELVLVRLTIELIHWASKPENTGKVELVSSNAEHLHSL